jgi:hypothetical protein
VTPLLYKKLASRVDDMTSLVQPAHRSSGATSGISTSSSTAQGEDAVNLGLGLGLGGEGSGALSCSSGCDGAQQGAAGGLSSAMPSGRLPTISSSQRLNTEAMLAVSLLVWLT